MLRRDAPGISDSFRIVEIKAACVSNRPMPDRLSEIWSGRLAPLHFTVERISIGSLPSTAAISSGSLNMLSSIISATALDCSLSRSVHAPVGVITWPAHQ